MSRKRRVKSVKTELIKKSREAMLAAVQIYNNLQVTFKAESFITLAVIGWTYLLHAFFRNKNIDYRYYHYVGKKKVYDKTKYGAYKHWELEWKISYPSTRRWLDRRNLRDAGERYACQIIVRLSKYRLLIPPVIINGRWYFYTHFKLCGRNRKAKLCYLKKH